MSDLNNNDPLENFFRKKAEEYNISFREKDWEALEGRLDAKNAQLTASKMRWLAAAVILMVFSVLAYFTYQNYQQIGALNNQLSQTEDTNLPPEDPGPDETAEEIPPAKDSNSSDLNSEPENSLENSNEVSNSLALGDTHDNESQNVSEEQYTSSLSGIQVEDLAITTIECDQCNLGGIDTGPYFSESSIKNISDHNPPRYSSLTENEQPSAAGSKVILRNKRIPRASLGFVLGPDLSTVGTVSNFSSFGYKLGLTADFHFNERFAITVGAIRSNVKYKASGLEYQYSQGYQNTQIHTAHTIGECLLIDIPIQLRYRLMEFSQSRLYSTAGFSSYIMLNEDYRFSYETYQPGYPERFNENTGTTHFMSNASFSVGYELDIARNVSLRAEPFIRVPIQEVGRVNVDLYSVGTLISLNYHLY